MHDQSTLSAGATSGDAPDAKGLAYQRMEPHWQIIDDLYSGTDGMRQAGERWLPRRMREPKKFYDARLRASFLYGALYDTVEAIVAKPFSKTIAIRGTLPEPLLSMIDDVDGSGMSLNDFAVEVFRCGWKYGAAHIVVDYPRRPDIEEQLIEQGAAGQPVSSITATNNLAFEQQQGLRPTFSIVVPEDMLGWKTSKGIGPAVLEQVRFRERTVEPSGEFGEELVERIRVMQPGSWRVFTRNDNAGNNTVPIWYEESGPSTMMTVPVSTFYVTRTGFMEATPPLLNLAHLNVAHWQSSSLQRNSLDVARIPILVRLGFPSEESDDGAAGIVVSSNVSFESPDTNAKAFYCEHSGAALTAGETDLKSLREQMEVLGLQPWMQRASATATGIASNDEKAESLVQRSVRSLESSLRQAFELAAEWVGVELPVDFSIDVFDEFGIAPQRSQDLQFLIQMRQQKLITHETMLNEVKKRAVIGDDVDIAREIRMTQDEGDSLGMMFSSLGAGSGSASRDAEDEESPEDEAEDEAEDESEDETDSEDQPTPRSRRASS